MRKSLAATVVLLFALLLSSCQGEGPTGGRPAPPRDQAQQDEQQPKDPQKPLREQTVISPSMGGTLEFREGTFEIPPHAVGDATGFTLTFPDSAPSGTISNRVWELTPNTTLENQKQLRITLPYDPGQFKDSYDHTQLKIARSVRGTWFALDSSEVDSEAGEITALSRKTGTFAIIERKTDRRLLNEPPQARINLQLGQQEQGEPSSGPRTIGFNALDSLDPDGEIIRYQWDLDSDGAFDESTGTPERVTATYEKNGHYTAVLRVEDDHTPTSYAHATATFQVSSTGSAGGPLRIEANRFPARATAPHTVDFASRVTGGEPPYEFFWEFGDGEVSELPAPDHTYGDPGDYTARLEVTDATGATESAEVEITTRDSDEYDFPVTEKLDVNVSPEEKEIQPGETVTFTVESENAEKPAAVTYYYGDETEPGFPEKGELPLTVEREYQLPGAYLFTVVVTDAAGRTGTDYGLVRVKSADEPRAWEFVGGAERGSTPDWLPDVDIRPRAQPGQFKYRFSAVGADRETDSLTWNFGDGSSSSDPEPVHSYSEPGTYHVELRLERDGRIYRYRHFLPVGEGLSAAIQLPRRMGGVAPYQMGFSATARNATRPLEYEWEFGDGETSGLPNPIHTYSEPGEYEVTVRVTDAEGKSSTSRPVTLEIVERPGSFTNPIAFPAEGEGDLSRVRVIDSDGSPELTLPLGSETGDVRGLRLSPAGNMLAYRTGNRLSVRDLDSGNLLWTFESTEGRPENVRMSVSAGKIAFDLNGQARLYTPEDRRLGFGSGLRLLDLGRDGSRALLRDDSEKIRVATLEDGGVSLGDPWGGEVREGVLSGDLTTAFFTNSRQEILELDLRRGADRAPAVINQDDTRKRSLATDYAGNTLAWVGRRGEENHPFVATRNEEGLFDTEDLFLTRGIEAQRVELAGSGDRLFYWGTKGDPQRTPTAEEVARGDAPASPSEMFGNRPGEAVREDQSEAERSVEPGQPALWLYHLREEASPSLITETWSDFSVAQGRR